MMWSKAAKAALAAVLLVVASTAVAAKGKLGFATEATSIGFISPVLECLKVITLWPRSLARGMSGQFKNMQVGQKLFLKVKRGGIFVNVDIVANK